jgi:hypothetical protein
MSLSKSLSFRIYINTSKLTLLILNTGPILKNSDDRKIMRCGYEIPGMISVYLQLSEGGQLPSTPLEQQCT